MIPQRIPLHTAVSLHGYMPRFTERLVARVMYRALLGQVLQPVTSLSRRLAGTCSRAPDLGRHSRPHNDTPDGVRSVVMCLLSQGAAHSARKGTRKSGHVTLASADHRRRAVTLLGGHAESAHLAPYCTACMPAL